MRKREATPRGFEPLRAEPNGFLVHLLNHSDTVSYGYDPSVSLTYDDALTIRVQNAPYWD